MGELLTPERIALDHSDSLFLQELYQRVAEGDFIWGKRLAAFEKEFAPNWFQYKDARSQIRYTDGEIKKAVVSRWEDSVLGIALVSGPRDTYSIPTSSLQFGIRRMTQELGALERLNLLENVVHRKLPSHGMVGDIYIDGNGHAGKLVVDCFTDRWAYGGKEINRWPEEKIISESGIAECIGIVRRTVELV